MQTIPYFDLEALPIVLSHQVLLMIVLHHSIQPKLVRIYSEVSSVSSQNLYQSLISTPTTVRFFLSLQWPMRQPAGVEYLLVKVVKKTLCLPCSWAVFLTFLASLPPYCERTRGKHGLQVHTWAPVP